MKIGVNTNLLRYALDDGAMDDAELFRRYKEAGFETVDYVLASTRKPDYVLHREDWKRQIDRTANELERYGLKVSQVHLPFVRFGCQPLDERFQDPESRARYDESMRRGYLAAEMLGAPWAVCHCEVDTDIYYTREYAIDFNHRRYDGFVEFGMKHGVGTAFENMYQGPCNGRGVRFGACYEDLIEFVDSFQNKMVGICWDFGHANLMHIDQGAALAAVGRCLKCVHVNDNYGAVDQHLLPFLGTVDWRSVLPVLKEIGYEGALSFEAGPTIKNVPRTLQPAYVQTLCETMRYLRDLTGIR